MSKNSEVRLKVPLNNIYVNLSELLEEKRVVGRSGFSNIPLIQRVQSKIGKKVEGYDDADGFIDDTEAIDENSVSKILDINEFYVNLSYTRKGTEQNVNSDGSLLSQEACSVLLDRYVDIINTRLSFYTHEFMNKYQHTKKLPPSIPLNDVLPIIHEYIEERVKLEKGASETISKRKYVLIRKDSLEQLYPRCFEVNNIQFTSKRKLVSAYNKYTSRFEEKHVEVDNEKEVDNLGFENEIDDPGFANEANEDDENDKTGQVKLDLDSPIIP